MKNFLIVAIIMMIIIIIAYNIFKKDTWLGFYYPNGCLSCQEDYIYSPELYDKESCLAWARNLQQSRNNPTDDFECGKNCEAPNTNDGTYHCEETVDY